MEAPFTVTLSRDLDRFRHSYPAQDISIASKRAMENVARRLEQQHKARHMHTSFGGTSPSHNLGIRTEKLRNSYKSRVSANVGAGTATMSYGSRLNYAGWNEEGVKKIFPRNKKWLAIPLRPGLPKAGRNRSGTFVMKAKSGRLFIWERIGDDIRPLYILARGVKLPPRPTVKLAHNETEATNVETIVTEVMDVTKARRY